MTQYNTLNIKLFDFQLNKLKSGIKNGSKVILNLSSNMIGDSNDEANFLHNLLLTIHKFEGFIKLSQIVHQLI